MKSLHFSHKQMAVENVVTDLLHQSYDYGAFGGMKFSKENLKYSAQCNLVHHKSHMTWG
jgi:hypothetical protein